MPDVLSAVAAFIRTYTDRAQEIEPAGGDAGDGSARQLGRTFEDYCKDFLAESLSRRFDDRVAARDAVFAFQGNSNNPPDAMYRGGDSGPAFEFKKATRDPNSIQLNSSHPEATLRSNNTRITAEARTCEEWTERELFYFVGTVDRTIVNRLWIVQGRLYAAPSATYDRLMVEAGSALELAGNMLGVTVSPTNELSRFTAVDALSRTQMRVRGMWIIDGPRKAFGSVPGVSLSDDAPFVMHVLVSRQEWEESPGAALLRQLRYRASGLEIHEDVSVPDPGGDPAGLGATVIRFEP